MAASPDYGAGLEYEHDVYLSFRGQDTRNNFVSHLYSALAQAGLRTFVDSEELVRGSEIGPELLTAIKKSRASVVIFSENYASSSWCLDELVKILEYKETLGHVVLPVFYHVNPSDVRRQSGGFGESFSELAARFSDDLGKVQGWRDALAEAGSFSGWASSDGISDSSLIVKIGNGLLEVLRKSCCPPPPADVIDPPHHAAAVCKVQYDVFISFRGEDTRNNFTSHLYAALARQNIRAFVDEESMRRDAIAPIHLNAIEESRSSVVVFSRGYASSKWCLDELVKILDCRETHGHLVLPVFYHVDPRDVRRQLGRFGEAFAKLSERTDDVSKVRRWKDALHEVGSLKGWVTSDMKSESFLLHEIITSLSEELRQTSLVGMDSRIGQLMSQLCIGSSDVRIVGIYGMGGVGKTALAKAVYDRIHSTFDASCFMVNVREYSKKNGASALQRQLLSQLSNDESCRDDTICEDAITVKLSCAKVLIVLDDVCDVRDLGSLSGRLNSFGPGSRTIVTTRDEGVLKSLGINFRYKVEVLDKCESLQLFSRTAFGQGAPDEDYLKLSERIVNYASGVPLALKVLGSSLYGRSKTAFESILRKTESFPDEHIQKALRLSYDGLDDEEKDIFLDIACFFRGENVDFVKEVLNGCGFSSEIGLSVLVEKGLLTISDNKLMMHDLLQDMGKEIVRQENIADGGKRSRLWHHDDVYQVLTRNTGTRTIEGICLDLSKVDEMHLSSKAFSKMHNLRLLKVFNQSARVTSKVHLSDGLDSLPNELRFLQWHGYPLKTLPPKFLPDNLIELDMPYSQLERLAEGTKVFPHLKRIGLSYSRKLIQVPELSLASNLEKLNLEGCASLARFPVSISCLSNLAILNMRGCKSLETLPDIVSLKALEIIDLSHCSQLRKIPEISWSVKELLLAGTAIGELPTCIKDLHKLAVLDLKDCKRLRSLPELPSSLQYLDAHNCWALEVVSDASSCIYHGIASNFIFSNCFKLEHVADNSIPSEAQPEERCMGSASMEAYKGLPSSPSASLCFPGSEIPGWLSFSSLGSSITIELPPHSISRLMGFVLCAVVSFENYEDDGQFNIRCECRFKMNNRCKGDLIDYSGGWSGHEGTPRVIGSDHVFLWYDCFGLHGDNDALYFEFFPTKNREIPLHSCKVKKCGVHPISHRAGILGASDILGPTDGLSAELRKVIHPRKKKIRTSSRSRRDT